MKEINPNYTHKPYDLPRATCPDCTSDVPALPAESATCGACGHRFPLVDPNEKGQIRCVDS